MFFYLECMCIPAGSYLTKWNDDDDLKSPSMFPYALSAVFKAWFNVMDMASYPCG